VLGVRVSWLVVGLVLPALLLSACGEDDAPESAETRVLQVEVEKPAAEEAAGTADVAKPTPRERIALALPERGNPLVRVRDGKRVELYDEPGGKVIKTVGDRTEFSSPTAFAVQRTKGAWAGVPTPYFENGRLAWLRLDSRRLKAFTVFYEVEVDLSEFRTDLVRRGKVIKSFPVSIGMPEAPTPTGRFAVTDTFRGDLNPAYGCCAVALTARQTRLPSGWLGGDRIAIHGTSGTLGASISNGCVRAADADVSELVDRLPPGTPVTIRQ
jgi:hypothetical protein